MKPDALFSEIYKVDEATDCYMIEIALDHYTDIFNEWDSAPFKRRDIDPDLQIYLEGGSNEIPSKYAIELCFTIPQGTRDRHVEEESRNGLKNSFVFTIYLLKKKIAATNAQMIRFVVFGFVLLWVATVFSRQFSDQVMGALIGEGLFIGGWVFLWEAVSLLFFTNRDLYYRYRTYKRLHQAPIIFREAEPRREATLS